ncbi:MAG: hypothetical protein ACYS67_18320 [Planctomycetota bacterium]|jgi:hypothetical protein
MRFKIPDWLVYELREKGEGILAKLLGVREWLNRQNPKVIITITVVTVLLLITTVIGLLSSGEAPKVKEFKKGWFYDLNTGQLFVAKSQLIPPIEAPSGPRENGEPAGVKAYVFSYKHEPNELERFIGFLETFTPEAKRNQTTSANSGGGSASELIQQWGEGRLIRRIEDEKWFTANSKEGRAIIENAFSPNEKGERARYYPPE